MYLAEKEANPEKFSNFADALWWGVVRDVLFFVHNIEPRCCLFPADATNDIDPIKKKVPQSCCTIYQWKHIVTLLNERTLTIFVMMTRKKRRKQFFVY